MLSSDQHLPPPRPRLIWFLLLDSQTGKPYKNCSASAIDHSLITVPVIAQFRNLVHRQNPNKLAGIVPSQLLVYKNKAAFDRRNNSKDKGQGEPLDPTESIGVLGSTEDMLVVVVPPPSQQTPSFTLCPLPFFNSIRNVTERHGWISFGQELIPSTSLNSLYIRECYRTIASSILQVNGTHTAIITGTPGIGKSIFLIYLLWRLAKEGKRVLLLYGSFNIYYDGNGGVFWFARTCLPSSCDISFWNDTLWCLFDMKFRQKSDLVSLPLGLSTFIVSTSPRREIVNISKKRREAEVFYMPTWTKAELEAIETLFPEANNEWRDRFMILGGIPRLVLEDTTRTPTELLKAACKNCLLDDIIMKESIFPLVHVTWNPPFTESSVCYASPTAQNMIVRHKVIEAKRKWYELLDSCNRNPLTPALCEYIFEPYTLELLEKGGTFTCRQLVGENTEIQPIERSLDIPPSKKIVVDKVLPDQTLNQLYVPKTKKYAAIDAWIPGIGAFQMTVGKEHRIKDEARDDLAQLGASTRLYWLLLPLYYHSFTKKSPHDIEQYAIRIPYPDKWMGTLSVYLS